MVRRVTYGEKGEMDDKLIHRGEDRVRTKNEAGMTMIQA